ncbi:MAG: ATP-binding protein [Candidatus Acidiferrales bacterium]
MARGELLRKLFLSHKRGAEDEFRAAALEIISEEQGKKNRQLARDLMRIMDNTTNLNAVMSFRDGNGLPKDKEKQALLVEVESPDVTFDDIILREQTKAALDRIVSEYRHIEVLRTHGLSPKKKLLFVGPPGCGKTLCAKIISRELGLPLLYTRFDAIVSSYLGETASNLRKVFDYAASGRWLLFFDEFDAIGKRRDDENEHGELKRVVNSFLQLLDGFHAPSLVVAATNHEELLDPALWRRFDEIVSFPRPSIQEIARLISMKIRNFPSTELDVKILANSMHGMSHADVERVCFDAIKTCVIENKDKLDASTVELAVEQQRERLQICKKAFTKDSK